MICQGANRLSRMVTLKSKLFAVVTAGILPGKEDCFDDKLLQDLGSNSRYGGDGALYHVRLNTYN
jgi:hypothetical protein